ncbi:MAG: hypothetical protein WCD89_15950 [Anaerocolumna sp.]
MLKCTLEREKIERLNTIIRDKNSISPLNRFQSKELTPDDRNSLEEMGIIDFNGNISESIQPAMDVLARPNAVVKVIFTGGAGTYEHDINYDNSFQRHISFTVTPGNITIDDETNPQSVVKVLSDFVGKSNLKSLNISCKFTLVEALVVTALLDMERKSSLRAFLDEIPFTHNSYNTNMIWRIINSTSSSIQWFVCILNEIAGEHVSLSQQQVQDAVEKLITMGTITQKGGLYQLSGELSHLSNRMIIVDNILSAQASRQDDTGRVISTGFTCVQSGVHDLLFLEYNSKEIIFETITSVRLMDNLSRFLNCESYISQLQL